MPLSCLSWTGPNIYISPSKTAVLKQLCTDMWLVISYMVLDYKSEITSHVVFRCGGENKKCHGVKISYFLGILQCTCLNLHFFCHYFSPWDGPCETNYVLIVYAIVGSCFIKISSRGCFLDMISLIFLHVNLQFLTCSKNT